MHSRRGRTGKDDLARTELKAAGELFGEMHMRLWADRDNAEVRRPAG